MSNLLFWFWMILLTVTVFFIKSYVAFLVLMFCACFAVRTKNVHASLLMLSLASLFFQNQFIHLEIFGVDIHFYIFVIAIQFVIVLLEAFVLKKGSLFSREVLILSILNVFLYCHLLLGSFDRWEVFMVVHNVTIPTIFYFVIISEKFKDGELEAYISDVCMVLSLFSAAVIAQYLSSPVREKYLGLPPITVAAFILLPLFILTFSRCYRGIQRLTLWMINLFALVVTMSRVFVVGYLILLVANHLFRMKNYRLIFVLLFFVSLGSTIMTLSFDCKFTSLTSDIIDVEKSYQRFTDLSVLKRALCGRVDAYKQSIERFSESTLLGNGITRGDGFMVTVHNVHLEVLEFVGLLGYMLFFVWLLINFKKIPDGSVESLHMVKTFTFASLLYVANACTNGLFHGFLFTILAISLGFISLARHHELGDSYE